MIKHILAGGCSFTSDGQGGVPPSPEHPDGGCSYIDAGAKPNSWVGFVAQTLKVSSLVNVAGSSHGNYMTAHNIITVLERHPLYSPTNTVVLFNVSDPGRLDIPCHKEHPDSAYCEWSDQVVPWRYINKKSLLQPLLLKNMGIEQVEALGTNMLLGLFSYLEYRGFPYGYMCMNNYSQHEQLAPVLARFSNKLINLDPGNSMTDHVKILGLNTQDQFHPDIAGHRSIANQVLKYLENL